MLICMQNRTYNVWSASNIIHYCKKRFCSCGKWGLMVWQVKGPNHLNKELSINRKVPSDIGLRSRTFSFFHGSLAAVSGGSAAGSGYSGESARTSWQRRLTVDEDVLSPDVVLAPTVVVLGVLVLQLRQRRQGRRGQQLWRRRRRRGP